MLLDCTLRDGGYVNNWRFDFNTSLSIIEGLYRAGIRWIEIGIMGLSPEIGKQTKFSEFCQIEPFLEERHEDCHYSVMVTSSMSDRFVYPDCTHNTPDIIRVAFFKPEIDKTIKLSKNLASKGYTVFLQPMATFMYSEDELKQLVDAVNYLSPFAMYMVDSFSTMYPSDVIKMRDSIVSELDENIFFGFHAHNNIQMAFANAQVFVDYDEDKPLFVDGSIFGMGRGAGNVPTELLMGYFNKHYNSSYDVSVVLELFDRHLKSIYKRYGWGYSLPYYITASRQTNSAWGWFFMDKGVDTLPELEKAIDMVPVEWTYTLNTTIGESIVNKVLGK